MKKLTAMMLLIAISLGLTACGSSQNSADAPAQAENKEVTADTEACLLYTSPSPRD